MSANTRHAIDASVRLAVSDLTANCEQLIREGKRDYVAVKRLLNALQLFKDNRLAGTVSVVSRGILLQRDEVLSLLSLDLNNPGLSQAGRRWCRQHGLRYLGEIFQITLDQRADVSREIEGFITSLGLPLTLSLDQWSWKPLYAEDPAVRAVWDQWIGDAFSYRPRGIPDNCHFVGQVLQGHKGSPGYLADVQKHIRPEFRKQIHAGMRPFNWSPPTDLPDEDEVNRLWQKWRSESRYSYA